MTVYLLYTIYEADYDIQRAGSLYNDLGLPITATGKEAKSRFRRLAALYHPDKVAGADVNKANDYFVHLKTAHDTLVDNARRFAYDRFGPDILKWRHCVTERDYVMHGAQSILLYYVAGAVVMYGMGLLGYLDWGRFERWLVMGILFLFEAYTVMRPYTPPVLANVINPLIERFGQGRSPYLQFQAIALAKKLAVTIYMAFSQIGPMLSADTSGGQIVVGKKGANEEATLKQNLDRLEALTKRLDGDTTNVLQLELAPFAGDREAMEVTWTKVKEWLVHNTIRSDVMVRDAMGRSFARRRADAPAGARGTR